MNFSLQQSACIQNIIFEPIIKNSDPLFIRISKYDGKIQKFSTDTYINIFHYKRWSELTGYNNFFLSVECRGIGKICLYGYSQKKNTTKLINFYNIYDKINYKVYKFDIIGEYDFYFLSWQHNIDNKIDIQEAYYGIKNTNCHRKIKIAIVSTTYNRLDDVKFLIKSYSQACKKDHFFEEISHLFIINNNYNDKNFFSQYETKKISIINNKNNYGGAGGFTQGAKLAVESGEFTHILFMDDDALVYEESWFRSIALLRYLREDLREHPVSAAMFTREKPTYCHAMIEGLNAHLHRLCQSGATSLDGDVETCGDFLSKAHETCLRLRLDRGKPPYPYAAWWYCLFPVEVFIKHGYPAPYFFCGDDIEYGLRIRKSPLFLNGVCVWHPAFENKWSPLREYLSLRNYALRCAAHMKGWRYELIKTFLRKMARCLAANDYERGALTILALNDFLDFEHVPREGRQLITRVETERLRWANKTQAIGSCPHKIQEKPFRYNILPMFYVFFTLGGALVPSRFRRRNTTASFLQVGGRWASECTAYDRQKFSRKFNNKYAIKLTIKTFVKLIYIQIEYKNMENLNGYF